MEIYSNTTRFALACNTSSKIIEPIQSRCAIVRFSRLTDQEILARLMVVLQAEKVSFIFYNALSCIPDYISVVTNKITLLILIVIENFILLNYLLKKVLLYWKAESSSTLDFTCHWFIMCWSHCSFVEFMGMASLLSNHCHILKLYCSKG